MTSSPSETIAKAMEGEFRRAAVNLVDTLVLERETNGQSKEFMDWAVFMTVRAFEEQLSALALKLEAMQREMAEKDAEIGKLRGLMRDNGTPKFNAVCERAESAERDLEAALAVVKECHSALKMLISPGVIQGTTVIAAFAAATAAECRARTLIQGEKK